MSEQPAPAIRIQLDGPYLVRGLYLRRTRPVISEHGEPMAWQTTAHLETDDVALCRCGQSANKPYYDDSHTRVSFDGTETAPTDAYDDRAGSYPTTGVEVRDDRLICQHAGFCGNRQTNVWAMAKGDATDNSAVRAQMLAMIEHCPSGALTARTDDGRPIEPALAPAIGIVDHGPLAVTGNVPVQRADGQPFEARNRVTLCRCGQSANKPLCDGSHADTEFDDGS